MVPNNQYLFMSILTHQQWRDPHEQDQMPAWLINPESMPTGTGHGTSRPSTISRRCCNACTTCQTSRRCTTWATHCPERPARAYRDAAVSLPAQPNRFPQQGLIAVGARGSRPVPGRGSVLDNKE